MLRELERMMECVIRIRYVICMVDFYLLVLIYLRYLIDIIGKTENRKLINSFNMNF